jgi:uncharacterized membrane protein
MNLKNYLRRLKNPTTVASLVSFLIIILVNFGIEINSEAITNVVNAVCGILLLLGVMNNPDTLGMDLPGKSSSVDEDEALKKVKYKNKNRA